LRAKSPADRTPARFGDDLHVDRGNAFVRLQDRVKRNRQKISETPRISVSISISIC